MSIKGAIRELFGRKPAAKPAPDIRRRSYYSGAAIDRLLMDWITSGASADQEIMGDLRMLRSRARDLARNNPIAKQYLNLAKTNVVGHAGPKLQAQVKDNNGRLNKRINDLIEEGWKEWAKRPTVDGRLTMVQFEQLVIKSMEMDGEVIIRKVVGFPNEFGFALQLIDPDQLDHNFNRAPANGVNEIRLGVEIDEWGRPVAYHVNTRAASDVNYTSKVERLRIPAAEIEHIYDPDRVNQTRGVTRFASVLVSLKMIHGFSESAVVAARIGASKMGFIEDTNPDGIIPDEASEGTGAYPMTMDAAPGTIERLDPGLKFTNWDPNYPSGEFGPFVKAQMRQVACGVGCSYNALANDLEGVNYSSMRSGLLIERDTWKCLQTLLIDRILVPVYDAWLACALLTGAVRLDSRDPAKFRAVKFIPRGWAWVDPLKDINAAVIAIEHGMGSRTQALGEAGEDLEETLETLKKENELAEQYGVSLTPPTPAAPGGPPPADDGEDPPEDKPKEGDKNA